MLAQPALPTAGTGCSTKCSGPVQALRTGSEVVWPHGMCCPGFSQTRRPPSHVSSRETPSENTPQSHSQMNFGPMSYTVHSIWVLIQTHRVGLLRLNCKSVSRATNKGHVLPFPDGVISSPKASGLSTEGD